MDKKFVECVHIFALSWKRVLTKGDYNFKVVEDIGYSIEHYLSCMGLDTRSKFNYFTTFTIHGREDCHLWYC